MIEPLLDIKDAARFLKVSEMTIRRWTNSGTLKCYRLAEGGRDGFSRSIWRNSFRLHKIIV